MLLKQRLFNKFIDIEFLQEVDIPVSTSYSIKDSRRIAYKCPEHGIKPNITISGQMLPGNKVSTLTIKIVNFVEDIDLAAYKAIAVRAGYRNGPSKYMTGQLFNVYVEKPNPEGVIVFQCVLSDLQNKNREEEVVFTILKDSTPSFPQLFDIVAKACKLNNKSVWPKEWMQEKCTLGGKTYTFPNVLQCITWLKNLTDEHRKDTTLPPLVYSFKGESDFIVTGNVADNSSLETILLEQVSSAYYWGGAMSIKAPWNPLIETQTRIQMPSHFFKGRLGSMFVKRSDTSFTVNTVDFVFSTREENSMTITAVIEGKE